MLLPPGHGEECWRQDVAWFGGFALCYRVRGRFYSGIFVYLLLFGCDSIIAVVCGRIGIDLVWLVLEGFGWLLFCAFLGALQVLLQYLQVGVQWRCYMGR